MKTKIIGLLIAATLMGCGSKKEAPIAADLEIRPVNYMVATDINPVNSREFSGTIIPAIISKISFRVSGTIVEKYVSLGSTVKKGQVLANLDPSDYQIKYDTSLAQYKEAEARVINAKSVFERSKILFLDNSISKSVYQQDKANYDAGLAQLKAVQQNVDFAKTQLEYTSLISPANGTIAQVDAQVNETVNAGTPIFTLSESGELQVLFSVSDAVINNIFENEIVTVSLLNSGDILKGKITNIGTVSNAYGNTFPVKATLLDPNPGIKPGMTASVTVDLKSDSTRNVYIPVNSVLVNKENKNYVMVLKDIKDGSGTVERRIVELGAVNNNGVEIISGIKPGDYIITAGASVVTEGQIVKLGEEEGK